MKFLSLDIINPPEIYLIISIDFHGIIILDLCDKLQVVGLSFFDYR
jgi:hypothetical protein